MLSLLYYSGQFCGTRVRATEAEIGSDASRTFLTPFPSATCPNNTCLTNTTVSVQSISPPPNQGIPSSLQCHPSSGSPVCEIIFHRGVRGTRASALPTHSSLGHLDSCGFLTVGHVHLVDHFIPACCMPSVKRIVTTHDACRTKASLLPPAVFFPFCEIAACLEVDTIFRASPVTHSWTSEPSLAGAVWFICFCFDLTPWQKFLCKTPQSWEPRDSENLVTKGTNPKCHHFHE